MEKTFESEALKGLKGMVTGEIRSRKQLENAKEQYERSVECKERYYANLVQIEESKATHFYRVQLEPRGCFTFYLSEELARADATAHKTDTWDPFPTLEQRSLTDPETIAHAFNILLGMKI